MLKKVNLIFEKHFFFPENISSPKNKRRRNDISIGRSDGLCERSGDRYDKLQSWSQGIEPLFILRFLNNIFETQNHTQIKGETKSRQCDIVVQHVGRRQRVTRVVLVAQFDVYRRPIICAYTGTKDDWIDVRYTAVVTSSRASNGPPTNGSTTTNGTNASI